MGENCFCAHCGFTRPLRIFQSAVCASVVMCWIVVAVAVPARAAVVLDQSAVIGPSPDQSFHVVNNAFDWAQSFTVGVDGILDSVGLELWADQPVTHPLLVDIRPMVGGAPAESDTATLASATLQPSAFPTFTPGQFTPTFRRADLRAAGVPVTRGEVLALVLRSAEPNGPPGHEYLWASTNQFVSVYPGGSSFERFAGRTWVIPPAGTAGDQDQGFQTYVDVPEPHLAWLLPLVAAALFGRRRELCKASTTGR